VAVTEAASRRHIFARLGKGRRVSDDDVEALACGGEARGLGKSLATAKAASSAGPVVGRGLCGELERRRGTVDAEHHGSAGPCHLHREAAVEAIEIEDACIPRQRCDEPAVVALVVEPPGLLPCERIGQELDAVLADDNGSADGPRRHPRLGLQPFERARRGVVAQDDGLRRQERVERLEDQRLKPGDTGGIELHDEDTGKAVDDKARQPVGFRVDDAIIRELEEPLAQPQGALEPTCEKAAPDSPSGVAIQEPGSDEAVRVEHRHSERAVVGTPHGDECAGYESLCCGIHPHLVRIDPRVATLGSLVPPGQQSDRGPGRRVIRWDLVDGGR